ncbi:hypothetical protein OH809_12290 [Streptomyces sp. NBC_00873]|uniref:hypothetical protein n=1 Tax=unclassified Streptomyces TaxID=2593676 RepID=UPI00386582B8|nr:hypothetical protein OH809_12290 [Streptomyces sp. NBC_00873]WTA46592.1 hypothetical protein OH821_31515 [Streptomyces sp. NBC_00842]
MTRGDRTPTGTWTEAGAPSATPGSADRACGVEARVAAVPAAVPEASRTALEILRAARLCGLPSGPRCLDDVFLAFRPSRPGPSNHRVAALLHGPAPGTDGASAAP